MLGPLENGMLGVEVEYNLNQALAATAFTVVGAAPGVDAYSLIAAKVAECKAAGGGTVLLPYIGGTGYTISQTIVVDFDNCTIMLDDDVLFTKTSASDPQGPNVPYLDSATYPFTGTSMCVFLFASRIMGPGQKTYIKRPQLIGLRNVVINGNATNTVGYTYTVGTASGDHSVVNFVGTVDAVCRNVTAKNGLTGCISMGYGSGGLIENCVADGTVYDNGIYFAFNSEHVITLDDTNPLTWSNGKIVNCTAKNCANHGIGSYGSIGVTITNPVVINCGNNLLRPGSAGPAGGIGFEHDGTHTTYNYHGSVINPRVYNSWGYGFRTNCKGTRMFGGHILNTKLPTADTSSGTWGTAVFVQGSATLSMVDVTIETSGKYGIFAVNSTTEYPTLNVVGGRITGCYTNAIYGFGVGSMSISPTTNFYNNGNAVDTAQGSQFTIFIDNSTVNTDAGDLHVAGIFKNNYGGVVRFSRPGYVDLTKGIDSSGNGAAWSSAYYMIYFVDAVVNAKVANIFHDNTNSKGARLVRFDGAVTTIMLDRSSVRGGQTGTTRPFVDFNSTVTNFFGNKPTETTFQNYAASVTTDPALGNPVYTLTGNMTLNAASGGVPNVSHDEIAFRFVQDATGGRTLTWNAAWKGVTLASSGTAGQRAEIYFKFTGVYWQQTYTTGWYS